MQLCRSWHKFKNAAPWISGHKFQSPNSHSCERWVKEWNRIITHPVREYYLSASTFLWTRRCLSLCSLPAVGSWPAIKLRCCFNCSFSYRYAIYSHTHTQHLGVYPVKPPVGKEEAVTKLTTARWPERRSTLFSAESAVSQQEDNKKVVYQTEKQRCSHWLFYSVL